MPHLKFLAAYPPHVVRTCGIFSRTCEIRGWPISNVSTCDVLKYVAVSSEPIILRRHTCRACRSLIEISSYNTIHEVKLCGTKLIWLESHGSIIFVRYIGLATDKFWIFKCLTSPLSERIPSNLVFFFFLHALFRRNWWVLKGGKVRTIHRIYVGLKGATHQTKVSF